jgi:hypothetical protein
MGEKLRKEFLYIMIQDKFIIIHREGVETGRVVSRHK